MSWFDEQPQPQGQFVLNRPPSPMDASNGGIGAYGAQGVPRIGITDPGQGGRVQTTEIGQPGMKSWSNFNPGYQGSGFLAGDQVGPAGVPTAGGPWGQPATTLPTAPPQATPQSGPANGDWQSWFNQLVAGKPFNQQTLLELEPTLNAAGVQLTPPNAAGDRTKINVPGVGWVRVGFGEGRPVWNVQDGGSGTIGSLAGGGGMADGSLIQPWNEQFQAPSPEQIAQDPSYQFQLGQGTQAIERSAASRGTLLTPQVLKGLQNYGQGLASTFSDKYYNRALGEYGLRKDNFQQNQDRPFTKLSQLATLGKPQTMQPPTG